MFSKNRLILILGIFTALMPFLGFPAIWKNFFYFVFGISISTLSFLIARHKRISRRPYTKKDRSNFSSKKEIVQSDYVEPVQETFVVEEPLVVEDTVSDLPQEPRETL